MSYNSSSPIERVIEMAARLPDDDELRAEWAQHLIIVSCGYIEVRVRQILDSYTQKTADERVVRFVQKHLKNYRNPRPDRIIELLRAFDDDWGDKLSEFWRDDIRDALNSLVELRNAAAHGRSITTGWRDICEYANRAKKIVCFLELLTTKA